MRVGAALNFVTTPMAGEGLALVGVPMFGVWSAPAQAHRFSTLRATGLIARAEGARLFATLRWHRKPFQPGTTTADDGITVL